MKYKLSYLRIERSAEHDRKDIIFDLSTKAIPLAFRVIGIPESKMIQYCLDYLEPVGKVKSLETKNL